MAHKVVVCGFGSCEKQADSVARELSEYYDEEVEGLSFREANADSNYLDHVTKNATVLTHSAGMMAIRHTRPREIRAIAPPLPTPIPALVKRASLSGYDLLVTKDVSKEDRERRYECGQNLVTEVGTHLVANLGKLGVISSFDAVAHAVAAREAGIDASLGFMNNDRLFRPGDDDMVKVKRANVPLVTLNGGHEEFVCSPAEVMAEYELAMTAVSTPH